LSPTPDGLVFAAGALARELTVATAAIEISDGEQAARAQAEIRVDGQVVILRAEFPEDAANFDWRERRVVAGDRVLDVEGGDWGRKPAGAVWTTEAALELAS